MIVPKRLVRFGGPRFCFLAFGDRSVAASQTASDLRLQVVVLLTV